MQKYNPYSPQTPVFNIEIFFFKNSNLFCAFHKLLLWCARGISQLVSGLYYVTRDTGYRCQTLLFKESEVLSATNFGLGTIMGGERMLTLFYFELYEECDLLLLHLLIRIFP